MTTKINHVVVRAAFVLAVLIHTAFSLDAAVLTVTSLADSGPGSLRDQVALSSPGDTIEFAVSGAILLNSAKFNSRSRRFFTAAELSSDDKAPASAKQFSEERVSLACAEPRLRGCGSELERPDRQRADWLIISINKPVPGEQS